MDEPDPPIFTAAARGAWLRLRTLILLRWLAVAGQLAAVLVAWLGLGIDLPIAACLAVIAGAALFNLAAVRMTPQNSRLTERGAGLTLMFDLCQLALLLFLTGGLANPFALLMVVPVTISASMLSLRATLLLGAVAAVLITVLVAVNVPLRLDGAALTPPVVLTLGAWASLVIGAVFLGICARRVTDETFLMSQALTATQMALDREQRFAALSGAVAAAAHELGTPLATIKLASGELAQALADRPDLRDDAELIRAQADRCGDILRSMGPDGPVQSHARTALLSRVVAEAAAPHAERGACLVTRIAGELAGEAVAGEPEIEHRPEIVQGLRNLVQNAVDFAASTVLIDIDWSESEIRVAIADDGPGFPSELIGRIGDPFLRRRGPQFERAGYEGMGLGLFIAKTLLERSGARLDFGNGASVGDAGRPSGALVTVVWPRQGSHGN